MEQVESPLKVVLLDVDSALEHVYFPDSGVISVVAVYSDGSIIEMATVGREGMTGFQEVFGATASSARLLVQIAGTAVRMRRAAFDRALKESAPFGALMLAYVHVLMEQVMLSAACNGAHSVKQRLARWLLMMRDRHDSDTLPITHDLLAEMLGVHRPTVTKAVQALEKASLVRVRRRFVHIVDREGLLAASCECYQLARSRTAQYLPKTYG